MRVKQCCCGCSLRTGTLILLWLDLLSQASSVLKAAVAACSSERRFSFLDSAMLGWGCIALVIVIYGIIGVEKHRPSYLLPYIGKCVASLIFSIFFMVLLWAGSIAMRDQIIDSLGGQMAMDSSKEKGPNPEDIRRVYNDLVSTVTVVLIICIAISAYFLCVIYSYYKQMQEEDKGIFNPPTGTGIVYAAPADQTKGFSDCPPAYGQQPAAAPYAPQNAGYPQLVGGYPLPQQNVGYPQQNVGFTQQNAGYPPQNVGYPQQQFPNYPEKQ